MWPPGLVAPEHVESSQTRDQTHVPCIDRQILIHGTTKEVLFFSFLTVAHIRLTSLTPQFEDLVEGGDHLSLNKFYKLWALHEKGAS